jgi:hypothetical protein
MEAQIVTTLRKAALAAALPLIIGGCVMLVMAARSQTQFEREHDAALKHNPWGVELRLKVEGDKNKFHAGDVLRFQEFYAAKSPRMWQLEVLEAANTADGANVAYISDGHATEHEAYATVTSDESKWRFVTLDTDPLRVPYFNRNTEWHEISLPRQPGRYLIYVQTHRLVLRKGGGLDPATHVGYPLTSNDVLRVEVVR